MVESTHNPRVFKVRLPGINRIEPDTTGTGTRTEVLCTVEFEPGGGIEIRYEHTTHYQRETPSLPWREVGVFRQACNEAMEAAIRAEAIQQVITAYRWRVIWK